MIDAYPSSICVTYKTKVQTYLANLEAWQRYSSRLCYKEKLAVDKLQQYITHVVK